MRSIYASGTARSLTRSSAGSRSAPARQPAGPGAPSSGRRRTAGAVPTSAPGRRPMTFRSVTAAAYQRTSSPGTTPVTANTEVAPNPPDQRHLAWSRVRQAAPFRPRAAPQPRGGGGGRRGGEGARAAGRGGGGRGGGGKGRGAGGPGTGAVT